MYYTYVEETDNHANKNSALIYNWRDYADKTRHNRGS